MKDKRTRLVARPQFGLARSLIVAAAVLLGLAGTALAIDRADLASSFEGY